MTSGHSRTPGKANGDAKQRQGPVTRVTSPRRPGCVLTLLLHARRYKPATAVTKGRTEAPVIVVDISAPQFPWRTGSQQLQL
jgi:hypothetical protein